jgi:hypothetical protein
MASSISAGTTSSTALVATADTTGALQLATNNGTVAVTVNTSQNVGVGTASPDTRITTYQAGDGLHVKATNNTFYSAMGVSAGASAGYFDVASATNMLFTRGGTESMRIDSSGNLFVGGTAQNTATKPVYSSTTAKAWVNFNGSGGINSSFNVSSVTRTSTGNFEVNFSSAMPNANYAATANSWQSVSNSNVSYNVFSFTTAKYQITTFENGAGTNPNATYSIVFAT